MRAPEFWNRDGAVARLLGPLGFLQSASVAWKVRHIRPARAKAKVICIGNLTAGGTGKTPVAIAVAEALKARGANPFFLTRGYGGRLAGPHRVGLADDARAVGDEALLLASSAPAIVARDRAEGARLADAEGADMIVMDDGHQNFSLAKDLSFVVVDGESGFGNGRVIPAGPLREGIAGGLARADAVVVVGAGRPDLGGFPGPVLHAHLAADAAAYEGRDVFAFAGIGRPEKFLATLRDCGAHIVGSQFFGDHHFYSGKEIARLRERAGSALLITTEKDFVRLAPRQRVGIAMLKVTASFDEAEALGALLDRLGPAV